MGEGRSIDQILNPWLHEGAEPTPTSVEGGRPPLETRLRSLPDGAGGSVVLDAATLYRVAGRLEELRGEVEGDAQAALRGADHAAIGRGLEVTAAVQYVHDRWEQKLKHLMEDMRERVTRVRRAADAWDGTETNITSSMR